MIKSLIVDDEAPARNELRRFLGEHSDFQAVGEAADGEEALKLVDRFDPDVIFLDIHMPNKDGLEVASILSQSESPPLIVFVTAYDEYAIQAFDVNAIDYVLKPYDKERFEKACEKVRATLKDRATVHKQRLSSLATYFEKGKPVKLVGHHRNSRERVFIHPQEVLFFHVELTEVTAHLFNGTELLVNTTLKGLLDMLEPTQFQQSNRSFIVNLDQVLKVTPLFSGNFEITLKDPKATRIPLSRRYAKKLKQIIKW